MSTHNFEVLLALLVLGALAVSLGIVIFFLGRLAYNQRPNRNRR